MSDAFSRLLKVLALERKQEYRNKAVIGGLDKFASRWESDARAEASNPVAVNEIVSGLNRAIASRIVALVRRIAPTSDSLSIAMSGGVAHNHGVVRALSQIFGTTISVPPQPDTVGALGAALIARERGRE